MQNDLTKTDNIKSLLKKCAYVVALCGANQFDLTHLCFQSFKG